MFSSASSHCFMNVSMLRSVEGRPKPCPVPSQMWQGVSPNPGRCGRVTGESSRSVDVAGASPVAAQMWQG